MKCSICERCFHPEEPGVMMPFCSRRCKMIDARRWLGEEYGLPYLSLDEQEEEPDGWEYDDDDREP